MSELRNGRIGCNCGDCGMRIEPNAPIRANNAMLTCHAECPMMAIPVATIPAGTHPRNIVTNCRHGVPINCCDEGCFY